MRTQTVAIGTVIALVAFVAAKPILNMSGMCTEGSISDWRYESIGDTLAFLDKNKPISNPSANGRRLATRYGDARLSERPIDGFPSRSMINMASGRERFLIKVEVDRVVDGNARRDTTFFFSPNCLRLPISGL